MNEAPQTKAIESIAIIGLAGRFPGANNVDEFWENIKKGVESIKFFSDQELISAGVDPHLLKNPNYVKARPVLDGIELFDAAFFGINPREAEIIDPQHRLFLECAWEALENSGYTPNGYSDRIGVFASTSRSSYLINNLMTYPDITKSVGFLQLLLSNDRDYLPTRVSYKMDLTGPSININTACSSSLVTVCFACQSLLNYQTDIALAGGVTIMVPHNSGYLYQKGVITSPDGHCRSFDAEANGTIFGSGLGIVVLKRLNQALKDRDHIYAIIKGSAINNDGAVKIGFTAPSINGQAEVVAEAISLSGIDAKTISYIETHGTGTNLGDPTEIAALTKAFRAYTNANGFCAVGSVKTNVGHLNSAAGITGLIKAILALKNKFIPPSLHFGQPNPEIDFNKTPFYVNTKLKQWKKNRTPRRAGVSSFGVGGTNAHVILEESPRAHSSKNSKPPYLLILSTKSEPALKIAAKNLTEHLKLNPNINMSDVAFTLQLGRNSFNHRRMVVCQSREDAIKKLQTAYQPSTFIKKIDCPDRFIIFMFPGQGSQYVNMGLELYRVIPSFRRTVNQCANLLIKEWDIDLRSVLFSEKNSAQNATLDLQQTLNAQLALFVIEYALAKVLMKCGIQPYAMIGHSIGEYVAACLAGVFSLKDALSIIVNRGKLMQQLPGGGMLVVAQSEKEIRIHLDDKLSLSAVNGPSLCVVSGQFEEIEKYEAKLTSMDVPHQRLHTSHAFHSQMMNPILANFTEQVKKVNLKPPKIPYISNVTGTWIRRKDATDSNYWAHHLRSTVRFFDGIRKLLEDKNLVLVEVGPGHTMTSLARQHNDKQSNLAFLNTLHHPSDKRSDEEILLTSLGQLWCLGKDIKWQNLHTNLGCHRIPLPTYPFDRKRFWIEPQKAHFIDSNISEQPNKKRELAQLFYRPVWKKSKVGNEFRSADLKSKAKNCLLFVDQCKLGQQIIKKLEENNQNVTIVKIGDRFAKLNVNTFSLNPSIYDHYTTLLEHLDKAQKIPQMICHLWGVTSNKFSQPSIKFINQIQRQAFDSLLNIVQVFSKQDEKNLLRIDIVTNNMQKVTDTDKIFPEKAIIMGPCRVIPKEYPKISCRSIDIVLPEYESDHMQHMAELLMQELLNSSDESVIAFRGKDRWIQTFEHIKFNNYSSKSPSFRNEGVYLITGGLGGVGLHLAEYLSSNFQAKLILIQRSVFPPSDEWSQWLETHDKYDHISRKIRKICELQKLGGDILVLRSDVTDIKKMRETIHEAETIFGQINGVIHCAGNPDGALISRRNAELTDMVMAPKVKGTLVIDEIFREKTLDFIFLFSSLSAYLAPVGQVGYVAANAFLDAFAYYKGDKKNSYTISIGWDTWKEVGMAANRRKFYTNQETAPSLFSEKTAHPLLGRLVKDNSNEKIYESLLNVDEHWPLSEHRVLNRATLPHAAYLDMVREAFSQETNNGPIVIKEAYFLHPLSLGDDENIVVRLILTKRDKHHEFSIKSNAVSRKNSWQEHAKGTVSFLEPGPVQTLNIQKIKDEIDVKHQFTQNDAVSVAKYFQYGPRWQNITWIKLGEKEGLAELKLSEPFAEDLDHYKLHPALFDIATGFMGFGLSKKNLYLPFYYKNICIGAPVPQKIISYIKSTPTTSARKETLSFRISVMDEHGKQLVEVEQYTLRKVDSKVISKLKTNIKTEKKVENIQLEIKSPGILDSLSFRPSIRAKPLPYEVEVEVSATGLNFKDVMTALGMVPPKEDAPFGFGLEFAGKIVRTGDEVDNFSIGDEVIGFANSSFSHYLTTPAVLVALKPSDISLMEGAAIPVAYITAYYALVVLGKLCKGERVLIHSAAGGVGMAALQIARWKEAEIFATAGTPEKRDYLSSIGIKNVYNSRSLDFTEEILADTENNGVNVILNSLAGEFIPKSLSILAPLGRFLEIGMRDILSNQKLGLGYFAKNVTFHAIMVGPQVPNFASIWQDLVQLFEDNILDLMPCKQFNLSQTKEAFKYMTTGEHIGKIIISHPPKEAIAELVINGDIINKEAIVSSSTEETINNQIQDSTEKKEKFFSENDSWKHLYPKDFFDFGILPSEGGDILNKSFFCPHPHILISTHNLERRMRESKGLTIDHLTNVLKKTPKAKTSHPRPIIGTEYVAPRNQTEEQVTEIWQQLLGIDKVGIYDNFFELGGHSLLAAQIYAQLREDFEVVYFPIEILFENPTVAALAEMIDSIRNSDNNKG